MSEKIYLWKKRQIETEQERPSVTPFLLPGDEPRPAVLVVPGGGYGCVCESTEGHSIAERFNALGLHAFVLHYRVAPHGFPAPLEDGLRAMKLIRGNAEKWHICPHEIAACGFSAGGHLAGSLGIFPEEASGNDGDELDTVDPRPDVLFLQYAVVTFEPGIGHGGTARNYCSGEVTPEDVERFSLEKRVNGNTPPVFLMHTAQDQTVDYHNALLLAEAMAKAGRPCELHLFPRGGHGMLLGLDTPDIGQWPELAVRFMETCRRLSEPGFRNLYTNAYQAAAEKRQSV